MASIRKYISYAKSRIDGQLSKSQQLNHFYREREWTKFNSLLDSMNEKNSVFQVWNAMKEAYFMRLADASNTWRKISHKLTNQGHFLAAVAFRHYVNALITEGNLTDLKKELPKLRTEHKTHLPINSITWVGALFIKHRDYEGCLEFLDDLRDQLSGESLKIFEIRSYPYYWLSKNGLGVAQFDESISNGLKVLLKENVEKGSPADVVLAECLSCWDIILENHPALLLELRYLEDQMNKLRSKVKMALTAKQPLMLLRLGDGEAYAFANGEKEDEKDIKPTLEQFWWASNISSELSDSLNKEVKETILNADIIGLPYTIRLSQTLSEFSHGKLSYSDRRQKVLFQGMKDLLGNHSLVCKHWVDEYSNYAFVNSTVLKELIDLAENVVIVGCFQIPQNHYLNNDKIKVIYIPPVQKISAVDNVVKSDQPLPVVLNRIQKEVEPLIEPGSLLLLAGGYAGKPLLNLAKNKGAVAIDFGSGIDHVLGYKTRSQELHLLFD